MTEIDVNITARGEAVNQPWLWHIAFDFGVKFTILKANIDADFGWTQVRLEGKLEDVQRAIAWLMTTGLNVETLQRAVGA
jgi:ABC-type methionine transport system ATPase subunit